MQEFLLIVHLIIVIALVATILMQRSEGGALGMGGGPGGMMTARGAANFLTRATTLLAIAFIGLSLGLAIMARQTTAPTSVLDEIEGEEQGTQLPDLEIPN